MNNYKGLLNMKNGIELSMLKLTVGISIILLAACDPTYIKASNTQAGDSFGVVAISGSGSILAVGAPNEASNPLLGQGDNSLSGSGAVYLYEKGNDGVWSQISFLKDLDADAYDGFGSSISLNNDGTILAIGAPGKDDWENDNGSYRGEVLVYKRSGSSWGLVDIVHSTSSYQNNNDDYGSSIALNGLGTKLAVNYKEYGSEDPSIYGVMIYETLGSSNWVADETISSPGVWGDEFGTTLHFNNSGDALVVGAPNEGRYSHDYPRPLATGAAYVFKDDAAIGWDLQKKILPNVVGDKDQFGASVSINSAGTIIAVGAPKEDSNSTNINAGAEDGSALDAGAAYIFKLDSVTGNWNQSNFVKASNTHRNDKFGYSVDLNAAGNKLLIGAPMEANSNVGENPVDDNNDETGMSGAVYAFSELDGVLVQETYQKGLDSNSSDQFGGSVAFNNTGADYAVSSINEDSSAVGVDGDATDNSASNSGAVLVYLNIPQN